MFPLSIEGKRPLNDWKVYQTQRPDLETIEDWFTNGAPTKQGTRAPIFNLALVTGSLSGLLVVDCDNQEALAYAAKNQLTSPITAITYRGKHFYFKHPGHGRRFANKAGGVAHDWPALQGLDFRGDGGYVVVPPSVSFHDDGSLKHVYEFSFAAGSHWDDVPMWRGVATQLDKPASEMTFADLDMSSVRIGNSEPIDVGDQIRDKTILLGRKLTTGDGTDSLMIRFCGQLVRRGLVNSVLLERVRAMYDECFEDDCEADETTRWLGAKIKSALQMDQANYPEDYNDRGERVKPQAPADDEGAVDEDDGLQFFTSSQVAGLMAKLKAEKFWAEPILPSGNIVQVTGYNGHGKSFFLTSMLTSLATGQEGFGPMHNNAVPRICYFDFDNPARTLFDRVLRQQEFFGPSDDNLMYWSPSAMVAARKVDMNLLYQKGDDNFFKMLRRERPDIVVLDSIRNAFRGMDENGTQHWAIVNWMAKRVRDEFQATVILVHHRNKPGQDGLGREAGSTAQLTDIDTQVMITQVYKDTAKAKDLAGIPNDNLTVFIPDLSSGAPIERSMTPFEYIEERQSLIVQNEGRLTRIRMVTQIKYGKLRNETELHQTHYIAYLEYLDNGESAIYSTPSRKQVARTYHAGGITLPAISEAMMMPMMVVEEWLK
jgi:hypothetical protein